MHAKEKSELHKGIECFNSQRFFEAHEHWEKQWAGAGHEKKFLQGLIFIAGAFFHMQNKNREGSILFFEKAKKCLKCYPGGCLGIGALPLLDEINKIAETLERGQDFNGSFPKIVLQ